MFVFDPTSVAFIKKSEQFLKEILTQGGIEVRRSRFLLKGLLYPLNVVVFEGREWGHFNAPFMQIGLNRKLIYLAKESVVRDILKHELAHYLTYILHPGVASHGREFHAVCKNFGFPKEVAEATMNLEESNLAKQGDLGSERILEKVKKLFMLAQSSNIHEAELATVKANEILLRHHLSYISDNEEPIYMDRLLMRKRKDTKLSAIYSILKHFIVRPVISQGKDSCCLEVSGSLTNVKLAGYVANFLNKELDRLWEAAKKNGPLKGLQAKNSFFLGVAEGFHQKMSSVKERYSDSDKKALVLVERKLEFDTQMIYRRLGQARSAHQSNAEASARGREQGRSLTIRHGVEGKMNNLYLSGRSH